MITRPELRAYACMVLLFLNSAITVIFLLFGSDLGLLTFWIGALIIPIFFQLKINNESFEQFGFWTRGILIYLALGIIISLGLVMIHLGIDLAIGGILLNITGESIVMLPGLVVEQIFVSLIEELGSRGYVQRNLSMRYSPKVSIGIASLFFALLHWINILISLGSRSFASLLVFSINMVLGGVWLGYAYYKSNNNLWLPIALHFGWNVVGYFFFGSLFTGGSNTIYVLDLILVEFEWSILTALILILGTVVIYLVSKTSVLSIPQEEVTT
ncbi:MAG: lysostaphin resistance A-like protein [Promethearchaeota archaeon]